MIRTATLGKERKLHIIVEGEDMATADSLIGTTVTVAHKSSFDCPAGDVTLDVTRTIVLADKVVLRGQNMTFVAAPRVAVPVTYGRRPSYAASRARRQEREDYLMDTRGY